jgi:serine/threonine protein kinase
MASFELDGFEPIRRIGGGGFGDVWLARQTNVDRQVAVKVGHAPIQDEIIKLRFDRECKALGRLSGHPNIIDVYTAGTLNDGRPYLVLEYVDGGTLWQQLKRTPIEEQRLLSVGEQLASALHEAHSSGVLHRDLKPENILMRSSGEAVLGDFGIARLQDGANTTSAAITASVAYAAPEVLGGTKASVASDIYGIGICLLAAILRSVPFVDKADKSIHPIISRVMSEQPPELKGRGVSAETADLVGLLLQKNPAHRPPDAVTVQRMFAELRASASPPPTLASSLPLRADNQTGPQPAGTWSPASADPPGDDAVPRWSSSLVEPTTTDRSVDQPHSANGHGAAAERSQGDSLPAQDPAANPVAAGPLGSDSARTDTSYGSSRPPNAGAGSPLGFGYGTGERQDSTDKRFSDSAKSFAIAYLATLAVGIVLLFIAAQVLG